MNGRRLTGAIIGGLVAGLGITVMLMASERKSGEPSEIATLERAGAAKLGIETPPADALPSGSEQSVVQVGHLLLSIAAGAAYAATTDEDVRIVPSGVAFGLAFYAAAHWIAGPLLGLKAPEWQSGAKAIGMHAANHIGFGVVTAAGASLASRR